VSKENYLKIANEAAHLERTGNFKAAGDMWQKAQALAMKSADVMWCEKRTEACHFKEEKKR
jgi:hypothetical protein